LVSSLLPAEELRKWREYWNLTQDELGEQLGITREWLGKLERGEREVSADVFLRFEALKRDARFTPPPDDTASGEGISAALNEAPAGYANDLEPIRSDIRQKIERVLAAAGNDRDRLGWIQIQIDTHLNVPAPWHGDAEMRRAHELVQKLKVAQDTARRARSSGA
jgi:transcriptional regulator with XRE-family HTH domain